VANRLDDYGQRRRRVGESTGSFLDRPRLNESCELTSRVSTNAVAETKRRLGLPHDDKDHIDVALATNMISVGLDITRLGLMVVTGQPKTASEYIQATSRVGRDDKRPGLVVSLLNLYRPRSTCPNTPSSSAASTIGAATRSGCTRIASSRTSAIGCGCPS
jgi:hypothetical protein